MTERKVEEKRCLGTRIEVEWDPDPEVSYLDQPEFSDHKDAYHRGEFGFIGIRAVAEVQSHGSAVIQYIQSGGLWGIESGSDGTYMEEIAREQFSEMADEALQMSFGPEHIGTYEDAVKPQGGWLP
jgi:hypothetical protein